MRDGNLLGSANHESMGLNFEILNISFHGFDPGTVLLVGGQPHLSEGRIPSRVDPDLDAAIRQWIPGALKVASRLCGSRHDAEDLVQTALLKVARHHASFRGNPAHLPSVRAWMYRILINTFRDRTPLRLSEPFDDETSSSPNHPPHASVSSSELQAAADEAIQFLPDRQREAILLSRDGLSTVDIAAAMDTSDANVRKLVQLARDQLRLRLRPFLEGP